MALHMIKHLWPLILAVLALLSLDGHAQQAPEPSVASANGLEALAVLIKRRQYPQAYVLADRLAEDFEGDAKFDFQYGLAALETAHYDQALFAFERLVLTAGGQPRYRLELARTHFFLRNLERAQIEFERVLRQRPPLAVRQNVEDFLKKIVQLQRSVDPKFYASFDLTAGFDSNINSATDEEFLPKEELIFPVDIRLNDDSRETESGYVGSLFNLGYVRPINNASSYDIRLLAASRSNAEIDTYDLTTVMFEAGYSTYSRYSGPIKWRGAGRYQQVQLSGEAFLNTRAGIVQAFYELNSGLSLALGVHYGLNSYEQNDDSDISQTQVSFSVSSPAQKHTWVVALQAGEDEAQDSSNDFNGRSYQGLTLQSSHLWGQRRSYYFLLGIVATEYEAINQALYSELREDTTLNAAMGWRHAFDSHLSMHHDVSWNSADSTLQANSYQRFKVELGVTYSF